MKIDLHVHSAEISVCAKIYLDEIIDRYCKAGYDAIVLTNHFNSYTANILRTRHNISDFGAAYVETMRKAEELGRQKGLLVLNGCEVKFNCHANDYLTYGMTEEHILDCEKFFPMTPAEFGSWARSEGILFYQAHPFRNGMTITDPAALFGIEVKNSHPRHDSRNDIAELWAEKHSLHKIGGSDTHLDTDVGTGGIMTDFPVTDINSLIHVLKNDLYTIF